MDKNWRPDLRATIGQVLRGLREQRSMSQGELGELLGCTQVTISLVERGHASLTAEQFLEVMRFFNAPAQEFWGDLDYDPVQEMQNALARLGADYLVVNLDQLPSGFYRDGRSIIEEVLLLGKNHEHLCSLAPVIIKNLESVPWAQLWAKFVDYTMERRLGWILECTAAALQDLLPGLGPGERKRLQVKWEFLDGFLSTREPRSVPEEPIGLNQISSLDCIDSYSLPPKARLHLWKHGSAPSRKWGILTALQLEEFKQALLKSKVARWQGQGVKA